MQMCTQVIGGISFCFSSIDPPEMRPQISTSIFLRILLLPATTFSALIISLTLDSMSGVFLTDEPRHEMPC